MRATDPTEQINVQVSLPDEQIPSLLRRISAKMIDFVALAVTVVGFSGFTGSYVAGLLIGYAWLAFSDSGGSLGKWALKLEVRDYDTGRECSAWASVLRNLPIIAIALPYRLHRALLEVDRKKYLQDHSAFL
ncbi:MAG TPA: RDD family protein [Verrucomicrobiae bacterium]